MDRRALRRAIGAARRAAEDAGATRAEAYARVRASAARGAFGPVPDGEGWLHEDFHLADKDAVFAAARAGGRIGTDDVVAATRVYTPAPIVEFLLQNTLGALWLSMHPDSPLARRWTRIVPDALGPPRPARPVAGLRILDPCCGAGAFLVEAAHMLVAMARDEARRAGRAPDEAGIAGCLRGGDLDADAVAIARRDLRAVVPALPDHAVRCLPGPLGSFRSDAWADEVWDVVVTNPPWIGVRQLDPDLVRRVRDAVGGGWVGDLAVAMQGRCWSLTGPGGRCGTVTPAGWLNDRAALPLRRVMLDDGGPRVVARLGQRVFDQASLVFCAMTVLERGEPARRWPILGADGLDLPAPDPAGWAGRSGVTALPSLPFTPAVPASVMVGVGSRPTVGDHFTHFDGVWTGDNARDVRYWWELADPSGWARLSGGQGREGWVSATRRRIAADAVRALPARDGCIEYPRVAGGYLCARMADPAAASLAGVVTLVPRDDEGIARVAEVLALFNSRLGTAWLRTLTSGLNFNPGYAARLPLAANPPDEALTQAVAELCALRLVALARDPTHDGFEQTHEPWRPDPLADLTLAAQCRCDEATRRHFGIGDADWAAMAPAPPPRRPGSAADDHTMVCALRALGMRWPKEEGSSAIARCRPGELVDRVADTLVGHGAPAHAVTAARTWTMRSFLDAQARRFKGRPIVVRAADGWLGPATG